MKSLVEDLRLSIKNFIDSYQYESALFFTESLLSVLPESVKDMYVYADILYKSKQFRRAVDYIKRHDLQTKYLTFRLLCGRCLFAIKEPIEAIDLLNLHNLPDYGFNNSEIEIFNKTPHQLKSECFLLLGEVHESIENKETATECYKMAIRTDVKCYSALRKLFDNTSLNKDELTYFFKDLNWKMCNNPVLETYLYSIYTDMFNTNCDAGKEMEYHEPSMELNNEKLRSLNTATRYFNNSFFRKCYKIMNKLISDDPYNPHCVILYSSVLKELNKKNDLYLYAYNLIEKFSDKKESWFSLGCYNFLIGKLDQAIRCYNKAIDIYKEFGCAWLALGHVLSAKNQRDQALRAYVSASYLIRGSHKPDLYIAIEYTLSKNMDLSNKFLDQAFNIGQYDPYFWHEKGYIEYMNQQYKSALECFCRAKDIKKEDAAITRFWEPLLSNMGHCYYKLGNHTTALKCFEAVIFKNPSNRSAKCMIALAKARLGRLSEALNELNYFMSRFTDHTFAASLGHTIIGIQFRYSIFSSLNMDCSPDNMILPESQAKLPPDGSDYSTNNNEFSDSNTKINASFEHLKPSTSEMDIS